MTTVNSLSEITHVPNGNIKEWYASTGGISQRLMLLYVIAAELTKAHDQGKVFGSLHPDDIVLSSYDPPKVKVIPPRYSTDDLPFDYADPLVTAYRALPSTESETFAFAILAFQVLTLCHPFKGEMYESDFEESDKPVSPLSYEYIGYNGISEHNNNEVFEYETSMYLSENMANLFTRMFVSGITEPVYRPTLQEIGYACLQALRLVKKCYNHGKYALEYFDSKGSTCPFCRKKDTPYAVLALGKRIQSENKILIPDSLHGPLTPATAQIETGKVLIYNDEVKITESCFRDDVPLSRDATILILSHKSSYDRFGNKRSWITIDNKSDKTMNVPSHSKQIAPHQTFEYDDSFQTMCITWDDATPDECFDVLQNPYGTVSVLRYLTVHRGGFQ